jgi:hypothetical protein
MTGVMERDEENYRAWAMAKDIFLGCGKAIFPSL